MLKKHTVIYYSRAKVSKDYLSLGTVFAKIYLQRSIFASRNTYRSYLYGNCN